MVDTPIKSREYKRDNTTQYKFLTNTTASE